MKHTKFISFLSLIMLCKVSTAQFSTGTGDITQGSSGKVGIGFPTYIPASALLEVKDGSVLFDGTTGATPASGAGTRMMWIPSKNAFRAGQVGGTQWDDVNVGSWSAAFGIHTTAKGTCSFASGSSTTATGMYSTAFGNTTSATATNSSAFGSSTTASGVSSFAAGTTTTASGTIATTFGNNTVAQSNNSFVIGRYNYNPGTYSPSTWLLTEPLFVIGNGTGAAATSNAMTVLKNGKIGIGIPNPSAILDVNVSTANVNAIGLFVSTANSTQACYNTLLNVNRNDSKAIAVANTNGGWTEKFIVFGDGSTAIGTNSTFKNNANYMLVVNGSMLAKRIMVETGWSDFVFEKNYKLKTLEEVETYIQQNGHLPEIPSAKEVEGNGGDLGELVKLQMQKIEELTLYIIEQNKKLKELDMRIKSN